ncbi:MAG: sel1 repeat family protein [Geothrix sp.]|uniref:tetratricopeptide repeat protein n=1 Tax=Geothrix sp. TaxID=1962974 RepID=UPI00185612ED|nr:tetratricopeptide repeat protein [Geothrix sp.]NWJ41350.1 sel1 repeat family protein [Geothrix sp.]WIL20663.1 MAG: sel1 repeat family protein [Geothrix sp.]
MGRPLLILVSCLLAPPLAGQSGARTVADGPGGAVELGTLRARAQAGDAAAQFELGDRCHFGRGVPRDPAESARWYRMAAEQGHAGAQVNLGNAYFRGEGLARNVAEGYVWFALAAVNGQPGAATNRDLAAKKLSVPALRGAQDRVRDLQRIIPARKGGS